MKNMIVLNNGNKIFNIGEKKIKALSNINISIERGYLYAIMGHSGSGKSTLIQILGLLDNLSSGELYINGKNTNKLTETEKAKIRMKEIGFVFQSFYLNPKLKAIENIMLPMYINEEISREDRKLRAKELMKSFGLSNRINHFPRELSGGEQQRVAIARALANNPNYILADEPTGNLDVKNEEIVYKMLKDLSNNGKAVLVVSHSEIIKKYADKVLYMTDGILKEDL